MLTDEEIKALRNRIERESPLNGHLHITGATRLVREAEAATLATVTPLVQKICNSLENLLATVKGECPSLLNEDSGGSAYLGMDADEAITTARAFLSGATKESTDHADQA